MALSKKSKVVGWVLLLVIGYCSLGAVVYFVSLLSLDRGKLVDFPWIAAAQQSLFRGGLGVRNNWLAQPGCISPDPDLIYVPALGTCRFEDIEFNTSLTFNAEGRETGPKPAGTGIAVLGDSHAMGWGVNDEETYAARLQGMLKRPVYNLGVASYGTARELIRLERSGLLDKVDTVILQYCSNDYRENLEFDGAAKDELQRKLFDPDPSEPTEKSNKLGYLLKGYGLTLAAPFKSLSDRLRRKGFDRHYPPLIEQLRKHAKALDGKRVLVFYSNTFGQQFRNFPHGPDASLPQVQFVDLHLERSNYRQLDDHLTVQGHRVVAERLFQVLNALPKSLSDAHVNP
jgi:hypothetical protein